MATGIFREIADKLPGYHLKLRQAGIKDRPEDYVKKMFTIALYATIGLSLPVFVILNEFKLLNIFFFLGLPIFFLFIFMYVLKLPELKGLKVSKDINREIVYAGRFLIIEMESGVTLYDAMSHVSDNFEIIGKYFDEIINKIDIGTPLEEALNEAVEITPSTAYRKMLWQIINSLKTGADISRSMNAVLDQIEREQVIEVKEYGRKLNPLAMFYMMIAIIVPSIGVVMLIIMATFIDLNFELKLLLFIAFLIGFMQFMFLSMIKAQRPAVEL